MSAVKEFYKWLEIEESKVEPKKRGRKPSKKQYFTLVAQEAIILIIKRRTKCYVIKFTKNILIILLIN